MNGNSWFDDDNHHHLRIWILDANTVIKSWMGLKANRKNALYDDKLYKTRPEPPGTPLQDFNCNCRVHVREMWDHCLMLTYLGIKLPSLGYSLQSLNLRQLSWISAARGHRWYPNAACINISRCTVCWITEAAVRKMSQQVIPPIF